MGLRHTCWYGFYEAQQTISLTHRWLRRYIWNCSFPCEKSSARVWEAFKTSRKAPMLGSQTKLPHIKDPHSKETILEIFFR